MTLPEEEEVDVRLFEEVNLVYASLSLTGDTLIWTPFSYGG